MITNWNVKITNTMECTGESWADVVSCTLTEEELMQEFDDGFGGLEGKPFTVWTEKHVYFPTVYDGAEGVSWVPRNPDGKPTGHMGGY